MRLMKKIRKRTSTHNTAPRNSSIDYLAMHYTGSTHSEKGTAADTCDMFASPDSRAASADFVVDDEEICQYNPNILGRKCYAVGGTGNPKKYRMSTHLGGTLYGKVTNANSISIEMKSSKKNRKSVKDSDTDWYLTDAVVENSAELAAYLLKKYNIPFSHLVMHHQVSYYGKLCPLPWCQKESDLKGWEDFKKKVKKYMGQKEEPDEPSKADTAKEKVIKGLQKALNKDYDCGLEVDGSYGPKTEKALARHNIRKGSNRNSVKWLQTQLNAKGFTDAKGNKLDVDGDFGDKTAAALKKAQAKIGCKQDAEFGTGTFKKFIKLF